jgi:hypothetical protein
LKGKTSYVSTRLQVNNIKMENSLQSKALFLTLYLLSPVFTTHVCPVYLNDPAIQLPISVGVMNSSKLTIDSQGNIYALVGNYPNDSSVWKVNSNMDKVWSTINFKLRSFTNELILTPDEK